MRSASLECREPPFALAPDPRFACLGAQATRLVDAWLTALPQGTAGLRVVIGALGSGKSLLAEVLLTRLPATVRVIRLRQPRVDAMALLETLGVALGADTTGNAALLGERIEQALAAERAQGRTALLLVDEAQQLPDATLEQIRLLVNARAEGQPLLQALLLATPALQARLARAELRAFAERIDDLQHLQPLDADDTRAYVQHRLAVAGGSPHLFSRLALRALHQASGGQPRLINRVAERALKLTAAAGYTVADENMVRRAARAVLPAARRARWLRAAALLALLWMLLAAGWTWWRLRPAPMAGTAPAASVRANPVADALALRQALTTAQDTRLLAWSTLLARWQVTSQDTSVAAAAQCEARIFPGFFCVSGNGSLEQLQRFNRPLILELRLDGATKYAVLLGVGDDRVTLDVGGRDFVITPLALATLWHGRFYAGFRVPAATPLSLRRGDHGDAVAWLANTLARADGAPPPADAETFDAALATRVRALQRRFGIRADGVVGPETLFALSALEADGPHLARATP